MRYPFEDLSDIDPNELSRFSLSARGTEPKGIKTIKPVIVIGSGLYHLIYLDSLSEFVEMKMHRDAIAAEPDVTGAQSSLNKHRNLWLRRSISKHISIDGSTSPISAGRHISGVFFFEDCELVGSPEPPGKAVTARFAGDDNVEIATISMPEQLAQGQITATAKAKYGASALSRKAHEHCPRSRNADIPKQW